MLKLLQLNLKRTLLLFLASVSLLSQQAYANYSTSAFNHAIMQQKKISLKNAISRIEQEMNYKFAYTISDIDLNLQVEYPESDNIETILSQMLSTSPVAYKVKGNQIILTKKVPFKLNVKVVDNNNKPVVGAMILIQNSSNGGITTTNGEVVINNVVDGMRLEVSYVGLISQTFKADQDKTQQTISMERSVIALDDVIITGYQTYSFVVNKKKLIFE